MKYSLWKLMIGITLICVVLGVCGRCVYLNRCCRVHEEEYIRCMDSVLEIYSKHSGASSMMSFDKDFEEKVGPDDAARIDKLIRRSQQHQLAAYRYRAAVFRPWTIVDESNVEP